MPISWPAQPPSQDEATTPYAAATDSRFIAAALTATATLRNATQQQQHRQQHHAADEQREPLGDVLGAVDRGGGHAADVHVGPVPAVAAGRTSSRSWCDEVLGARRPAARWSGTTVSTAVSPAGLSRRRRHRRDARRGATARAAGSRAAASPAAGSSATSSSGPLAPGAEALGLQVVRLAGGRVLAVVAGVREAEPDAEERRGQRQQHRDAGQRGDDAVPLAPAGSTAASRGPARRGRRPRP